MEINWHAWDAAIRSAGVVIERSKGTPHPRYPASIYPVAYGFIPGTVGGDGDPVDVFVGSACRSGLTGLIATRDAVKQDTEVKLLWNVSDAETAAALAFHNAGGMTAHLVPRPRTPDPTLLRQTAGKAYAYITHRCQLLLFRHHFAPEAGIQVPGGTVQPGEDPAMAVLREAYEETGLRHLSLNVFLGVSVRHMDDFPESFSPGTIHHRYFFHLKCAEEPSRTWRHYERHGPAAERDPIAFDFFWATLPNEIPELIVDQGQFLPQLLDHLS